MPTPTPFHERTSKLCTSYRWKQWAGYYTVCSYDTSHEPEYFAFRHAAGMIDVTPLFKYEVYGKDAEKFLSRVMAKNIADLKHGQTTYCCWCDDEGKLVDDGTVTRLEQDYFRVTAAEPSYSWFMKYMRGYNVTIEDSSNRFGALAIQGPNSRELLKNVSDASLDKLRFFRTVPCKLDGKNVWISRTGYTGDLGYEVWMENKDALPVWDAITAAGKNYGLEPCGMDAMDVTRVEAGFIMNGVDYWSANHCVIDARKSSPYEVGLGWTVQLDRAPFNGQAALIREKQQGSPWGMVGIEIDWLETEALFAEHQLPPQVCSSAWRTAVPIYDSSMNQVGYASSGAWSPILKKNLALATLKTPFCKEGTKLKFEMTVEFERRVVTATVTKTPFFDPERKRSLPNVSH